MLNHGCSARALALLAVVPIAGLSRGQSSVQELNDNLADQAASAIEVFSAGQTVSAGTFHFDNQGFPDVNFQTFKLPWAHTFGDEKATIRPLLEAYAGYFDLSQGIDVISEPAGFLHIRSATGTVGGGGILRLTDWLTVSPRLGLAYSHIWQNFNPNDTSPGSAGSIAAGLIDNYQADVLTILPSAQVDALFPIGRWRLGASSKFTYLHLIGLYVTTPDIDIGSYSEVWRNELSALFAPDVRLFGMPLELTSLFARDDLYGQLAASDFVNHFYEARCGADLLTGDHLKPLSKVGLSGAYYFGGAFDGWSLGLTLDI